MPKRRLIQLNNRLAAAINQGFRKKQNTMTLPHQTWSVRSSITGLHFAPPGRAVRSGMKVLHVIPSIETASGGPVRALVGFIRSVQTDADTHIATTDSNLSEDEFVRFEQAVGNTPVHLFRHVGSHTRNISIPLLIWLEKNMAAYDLLHIHALFHPISTAAAFLARLKGIPYIVRPLGTLSPYTFSWRNRTLKKLYYRFIEQYTVKGAAAVHFTSQMELEKAAMVCDPEHSVVIANPVEPLGLNRCNGANGCERKKILFMSRIDPKKGLDVLITAFVDIAARHRSVDLVVAGSGDRGYESQMKLMVEKAGLNNRVQFVGFAEGKAKMKLLEEATVFALPSHDENFGIAVAEAMSAGVPVVISDQVAISRDVREYGAGMSVPSEAGYVEDALEKLIFNPKLCARMGGCGKKLIEDRYSSRQVGNQLVRLYHEVAGRQTVTVPFVQSILDEITPVIRTYNEAANIKRALERLHWAKDIVVVDSFSDDETLKIVKDYPSVRVVKRRFDNFANQMNYALHETGIASEWVLAMDADYVLTSELLDELQQLQPERDVAGYRPRFRYCVDGRPVRGGVYPAKVVLFRHGQAHFRQDGHADRLEIEGKVADLRSAILHDDRKPLSRWITSQGIYSEIEATKLLDAQTKGLRWPERVRKMQIFAPFLVGLHSLFVKGGILDGKRGFYYAFQRMVAEFLIALQLMEKSMNEHHARVGRQSTVAKTVVENFDQAEAHLKGLSAQRHSQIPLRRLRDRGQPRNSL